MGQITDHDIYLFKQGSHFRVFDKLGAHLLERDGARGVKFAVWAPNAAEVSVIGDFNGWRAGAHPLTARPDGSGIWETFVPGVGAGALYKYHLVSHYGPYTVRKADPVAFRSETPPNTASIVWDLAYQWGDSEWMQARAHSPRPLDEPWAIYEVHLGSWRRVPAESYRSLTYREMAHQLAAYVREMGFTHVELLPVMEHPFYGSWGYQVTGYFAPTGRYGTPQDLMYLIDHLHQNGIGVILDWVPSHFPGDEHGLIYFDGTHLYEHADPRQGFHPDWSSYIFNYGRNEVRSFLVSSAVFWLDKYHADSLRVDAVASMLYLDYARRNSDWVPNIYGGNENLDAIHLLRSMNREAYAKYPGIQTIAEESTAWPMVSRPTHVGGLGFGMKWNMGWMHDTLRYFSKEPIHRKYHHGELSFSIWYAFSENFVLPLSHDEVVHGKGSILNKMSGDDWQKLANLRLLLGYMYTHPGKKLLFMGTELGQWREWNHEESLDWHLLQYDRHLAIQRWVKDLNHFYRSEKVLWQTDFDGRGFEWIDFHDAETTTLSYMRKGLDDSSGPLLAVANFTPVPRPDYRIGAPAGGFWREVLNSDATLYGGSGLGNMGGVEAHPVPCHGRDHSLTVTLPPLAIVIFRHERTGEAP
ncbi:MAG: 1,4-alpha-glucan branching protein GlgB [Planctomycetota bacterium]